MDSAPWAGLIMIAGGGVFAMSMDDPDEDSPFRRAFEAKRIIDVHWEAALASPRRTGCLECRDWHTCAQLDWATGIMATISSVILQKP